MLKKSLFKKCSSTVLVLALIATQVPTMAFATTKVYEKESISKATLAVPNANYPDYSKVNVGQGKEWGQHVFAPYVDSTNWPPVKLSEVAQQTGVKYFNLGFIVAKNSLPSWGTYYAAEEGAGEGVINQEIKKLRDMGGDVMVSFGGQANTPLHVAITDVNILKEQYKRFIDAYGLTNIDFDIEGDAVSNREATARNTDALVKLQQEYKAVGKKLNVWFTLPVLPTGLTDDGVFVVQDAVKKGLEFEGVNVMTMDYGDDVAPNPDGQMGKYAIDSMNSLFTQIKNVYSENKIQKSDESIWTMIGTTPMIGVNDIRTEVFRQTDATRMLNFALEKKIGYIGFWSVNRDQPGPIGELSDFNTGLDQKPYEFCTILNDFMKINTSKPIDPPSEDKVPPTSPSNLVSKNITNKSVEISWDAATDNVGVTGYEVYRDNLKIATVTTNSYSDNSLKAATNYNYYVVALDKAGNKSQKSTTLTIKTLSDTTPPVSSEWRVGNSYKVGDKVTYSGKTYTCLQPHTALVGWEPSNVPSLWMLV
ncbi:chitinase [Clostridium cavendishii DSM 21758]|uniref:Chitinase n=1 Tax=Clostridium cavendishii DSM 21758 TaxID=1121302 RepID=A0A1M6DEH8_9CLOT|nr:carbohydrate-binding protein [Clostridium cavendishii]SHI71704.1 chitinase [Clostridium cavendishii DSM 21758]